MVYRYQDLSIEDRALHDAQNDERYIKVSVGVIRALKGDVSGALFISHLAFLSKAHADKDGWFWRNQAQIEAWTGMSEGVQLRARKRVEAAGLLSSQLRGVPARMFYRVNILALLDLAKEEARSGHLKILDSADQGNQFLQDEDTSSCSLQEPAPAACRDINKKEINDQIISGAGAQGGPTRDHGAIAEAAAPEPEDDRPEPMRAPVEPPTPLPPSQPATIGGGWAPDELAKLRAIVAAEYPDAGPAGYRPGKAALDALARLPRDRANDFVRAVRNYARKVQGEEARFTRGLARFLEDGFWEQFVRARSAAARPADRGPVGRDINAEADAASHAVKLANSYIPAFDRDRQEAS
jgi:hypothetical protein